LGSNLPIQLYLLRLGWGKKMSPVVHPNMRLGDGTVAFGERRTKSQVATARKKRRQKNGGRPNRAQRADLNKPRENGET